MKRIQIACASLFLSAALFLSGSARAEDTLRPEIGKPMLAAQELVKAQKYKEAMAKIREAEVIPGRTAYENYIIERMRATAAAGAGDTETAAKSFESIISSGKLPAADQLKVIEALAGTYYRAKDYAQASIWVQKYIKSGGSNPQMRQLLLQSMYLGGDYVSASKEVAASIAETEKSGGVAPENMLQLQANCQLKIKDYSGYVITLERLIKHYPKTEYWADILSRVQSKPGFPDRLLLDVYRLRHSVGILAESNAYVEYAQLALQEGFPSEARKIVSKGFEKKLLGNGSDASRHGRLRDMANRLASEDRNALDKKGKVSERGDASLLVNDGYAYITHGEFDKGISLIEKGISKDGLKRPEDAALHLGLAYIQAGNKPKAGQVLKALSRNGGGAGDLARLWMLQAHLE